MKKIILLLTLFAASMMCVSAQSESQLLIARLTQLGYPKEVDGNDVFVPHQAILRFRPNTTNAWKQRFKDALSLRYGIQIVAVESCNCEPELETWTYSNVMGGGNTKDKTTQTGELSETMNGSDGGLVAIALNYYSALNYEDPLHGGQNPNIQFNIPENSDDGNQVSVSFLDSGVDIMHPYLTNYLWNDPTENYNMRSDRNKNGAKGDKYGFNYVQNNNQPWDFNQHGTHVAGNIVNTANCVNFKILPVKVFDDMGIGRDAHITCGIIYSIRQKMKSINISGGRTGTRSKIVESAVMDANRAKITIACAAGNVSSNNDIQNVWPASFPYPNIIAVGASNATGTQAWVGTSRPWGSNFGRSVSIYAIGENVNSSVPGGGFAILSGTSMATPNFTGALIKNKVLNPNLTMLQIKQRILNNAIRSQTGLKLLNPTSFCPLPPLAPQRFQKQTVSLSASFQVSPNPVTDFCTISKLSEAVQEIRLVNQQGFIVKQQNAQLIDYQWDMSDLPTGIYWIQQITRDKIYVQKIVKL